jgi:glutathione S-transferase
MRLYYTPTSPFVRKVMVVAHELGLLGRIETEFKRPTPWAPDEQLSRHNPLSKVPTLILDDGSSLFDSRVIVEYLDSLHGGRKLLPERGAERMRVLRTQALADGVLDGGVLAFYEGRRPETLRWPEWENGQKTKIRQGLDALEAEAANFAEPLDLGQIAVGVAIGWIIFREIVENPLRSRPRLAGWYDAVRRRPSFKSTEPAEPN